MSVVAGLTGGIACGKSTVAQLFVERGATLIDADVVARQVVRPETEGLAGVISQFGREVLHPDGTLNRAALGARVFGDPAELQLLNAILHPLIDREIRRQLAAADALVVILDAALLTEMGLDRLCDVVVVVWADVAVQRRRLMQRNQLSAEQADQRIAAQRSHEERLEHADHAIDNSAGLPELERQADAIWNKLVTIATAAAARL